jgi:hypothetical protein
MIKSGLKFHFSPSAIQASLQTSIVQARSRTSGAPMALIKKRDVKDYFASRRQNGIHLHRPVSQPDATGFSGEQAGRGDSISNNLADKTPKQPFSAGLETPPACSQADSSHVAAVTESKSSQA